jgi:Fe-Mn family superoxide dismutase
MGFGLGDIRVQFVQWGIAQLLGLGHMHNVTMGQPLLVLDMYEHSYQMDYGAAASKYIDVFMQNVKWEEVEQRFVKAQKARAILS